jgi:hypothetical protein
LIHQSKLIIYNPPVILVLNDITLADLINVKLKVFWDVKPCTLVIMHNLFSSGWAAHGAHTKRKWNAYRVLVGKPAARDHVEDLGTGEDNIRMDLKETGRVST